MAKKIKGAIGIPFYKGDTKKSATERLIKQLYGSREAMEKAEGIGKHAKPLKKVVAKRTVGKSLGKLIPGVGAAIIAHDVIKGVSKATCGKRGGKWVSGKCVGAKKTKFKPGAKVRDPISKR